MKQPIATKENGLNLILENKESYSLKVIIATPVAESSITFEDPLPMYLIPV